jgi:hypothetical protein
MSNEKQQTAVEWLIEQLTKNPLPQSKDEFIDGDLVDIIKEAKEMEKEQHEETALSIVEILLDNLEGKNDLRGNEAFEHIWNETYGGNE